MADKPKPPFDEYIKSVAEVFANNATQYMDTGSNGDSDASRYLAGNMATITCQDSHLYFTTAAGIQHAIPISEEDQKLIADNTRTIYTAVSNPSDHSSAQTHTDIRAIATIWQKPEIQEQIHQIVYDDVLNKLTGNEHFERVIYDKIGQVDPAKVFITSEMWKAELPKPLTDDEILQNQHDLAERQAVLSTLPGDVGRTLNAGEGGPLNFIQNPNHTSDFAYHTSNGSSIAISEEQARALGLYGDVQQMDPINYVMAPDKSLLKNEKLDEGVSLKMLTEEHMLHNDEAFAFDPKFGLVTSTENIKAYDPSFLDRLGPMLGMAMLGMFAGAAFGALASSISEGVAGSIATSEALGQGVAAGDLAASAGASAAEQAAASAFAIDASASVVSATESFATQLTGNLVRAVGQQVVSVATGHGFDPLGMALGTVSPFASNAMATSLVQGGMSDGMAHLISSEVVGLGTTAIRGGDISLLSIAGGFAVGAAAQQIGPLGGAIVSSVVGAAGQKLPGTVDNTSDWHSSQTTPAAGQTASASQTTPANTDASHPDKTTEPAVVAVDNTDGHKTGTSVGATSSSDNHEKPTVHAQAATTAEPTTTAQPLTHLEDPGSVVKVMDNFLQAATADNANVAMAALDSSKMAEQHLSQPDALQTQLAIHTASISHYQDRYNEFVASGEMMAAMGAHAQLQAEQNEVASLSKQLADLNPTHDTTAVVHAASAVTVPYENPQEQNPVAEFMAHNHWAQEAGADYVKEALGGMDTNGTDYHNYSVADQHLIDAIRAEDSTSHQNVTHAADVPVEHVAQETEHLESAPELAHHDEPYHDPQTEVVATADVDEEHRVHNDPVKHDA